MEHALLALADGSLFHGRSFGAHGSAAGEVVFNTAITGYQEILSDPSYASQIVTLTHPHIGNTGCNEEDQESCKFHAVGLVVRDYPRLMSSFRARTSLSEALKQNRVVAIAEIDTRRLTRKLRAGGTQGACLMAGDQFDSDEALARARASDLSGVDLASKVSVTQATEWREGIWRLSEAPHFAVEDGPRVVVVDFGVKRNILRLLVECGCRPLVVPAASTASEILAWQPAGILFSNGPGDPEACSYAIATIGELLETKIPLLGICLGHQLIGLACGGRTYKMKFGHHGANHPVLSLKDGTVMITSQNHGFALSSEGLPADLEVTHRSLFDNSVQGICHRSLPIFGFQGHPEASPGPREAAVLFSRFVDRVTRV